MTHRAMFLIWLRRECGIIMLWGVILSDIRKTSEEFLSRIFLITAGSFIRRQIPSYVLQENLMRLKFVSSLKNIGAVLTDQKIYLWPSVRIRQNRNICRFN